MQYILTYLPAWILGILLIYYTKKEYPSIVSIDKKAVARFCILMFFVFCIRFLLISGPVQIPEHVSFWGLFMVFWEDAVYTLPLLILNRLKVSNKIIYPLLALSAFGFFLGHLSYGMVWALVTLLYIPFISYRYGLKYGLGTVMICHIIYDVVTYLNIVAIGWING